MDPEWRNSIPMEGIPLPPLEDDDSAGRCRGDAPTRGFSSVDHDTEAYGGLRPVGKAPEVYGCSRSCSRSLHGRGSKIQTLRTLPSLPTLHSSSLVSLKLVSQLTFNLSLN